MKEGDEVVGPTPQQLMDLGVWCHKRVRDEDRYIYRCDVEFERGKIGPLSHDDWEKVTCPECLALRRII